MWWLPKDAVGQSFYFYVLNGSVFWGLFGVFVLNVRAAIVSFSWSNLFYCFVFFGLAGMAGFSWKSSGDAWDSAKMAERMRIKKQYEGVAVEPVVEKTPEEYEKEAKV